MKRVYESIVVAKWRWGHIGSALKTSKGGDIYAPICLSSDVTIN